MTTTATTRHMPAFRAKMEKEGLPPMVIDAFCDYYRQIAEGATGLICDQDLRALGTDDLADAGRLDDYAEGGRQALMHTVVIKLNGGLGTSMGLTAAKSLIPVRGGRSFLEIILEQTRRRGVALALMNSFSTHSDTLAALDRCAPEPLPLMFQQHKFPKILQQDLEPAAWPQQPELEWNPPGHGDIYAALYASKTLHRLLADGIRYAFVSNSDNLGAVMEPALLGYFVRHGFPFMMEAAERTPSDMKGGHLARRTDGRLVLREIAQCPPAETAAFSDINRYRFFNTNSLWIDLAFLKARIESREPLRLPLIVNPKHLVPRDDESPAVYQLETAMGAAISQFEGATAVKVPRTRFFPVKKCPELLLVRSDCFAVSKDGGVTLNPGLEGDLPQIRLDPRYYGAIDRFEARFKHGVPSLVGCRALTIDGDVAFEKNVTILGRVVITNRGTAQATIDAGAVIDGDLTF